MLPKMLKTARFKLMRCSSVIGLPTIDSQLYSPRNPSDWRKEKECLFFLRLFILAPFCFSARKKKDTTLTWREKTPAQEKKTERKKTDEYVERKQDPKA